MNTVIFLGSPRKRGNTELLLEQIRPALGGTDNACELIRLPDLDIHPCTGCGACEKTGICVVKDDMQALYEKISQADRIIIGSPIYFYNLTAQSKLFIDRCQALWSKKYLLHQPIGSSPDRRGYLVSVCATNGKRIFEGARLTARYALNAMDCSYGGELLVRGLDKRGAVAERPDILQQAINFGHEVAGS
jgi:multimeric flavodoxin WrbA